MKKILLTALMMPALFTAKQAAAQFHLGAGLNLPKYGNVGWQPGIQARAGYDFMESKFTVAAGFNFSPMAIKESEGSTYTDATGATQSYSIINKYSFNNAFLHVYRNFGQEDNRFRFFVFAGASMDFVNIKTSTEGNTQGSGISISRDGNGSTSLNTAKVNFGLGGNYDLGSGKLFAELMTGLRATEANGQYIENPGVSHYGLTVGYKFYFGSNNY